MNPNLHNVADLERIDALADDLATATRLIKELEAELRTECVHCGQPIPHVHKHESTRELALRLRAEKAEAELSALRNGPMYTSQTLYLKTLHRAEKAEAEVERANEKILWLVAHDLNHGCNPEERWRKEGGGRESESLLAKKATPRTRLYNQATDRWEEVG